MHLTINKILAFLLCLVLLTVLCINFAQAKPPRSEVKSKFYDFSEQLINGHKRTPTITYTNVREKVRFERLLSLKKSFLTKMFDSSKNPVLK